MHIYSFTIRFSDTETGEIYDCQRHQVQAASREEAGDLLDTWAEEHMEVIEDVHNAEDYVEWDETLDDVG